MLHTLSDATLHVVLGLLDLEDCIRLACVNRQTKLQVLQALQQQQHSLTLDVTPRMKHKSFPKLVFAGRHCPQLTALALVGSAHSIISLEFLQPCLTEALQELSLNGFDLTHTMKADLLLAGDCSHKNSGPVACRPVDSLASQLVQLLVQRCPGLVRLNLQDCRLPNLQFLHPLLQHSQQLQQGGGHCALLQHSTHFQEEQPQALRILQLSDATFTGGESNSGQPAPPAACTSTTTPPDSCGPRQNGTVLVDNAVSHKEQRSPTAGLQELWLRHPEQALTPCNLQEDTILRLLQACNTQNLKFFDVSRRQHVGDKLIHYLAHHCPSLRLLDVSLTGATPKAVLEVARGCPHLATLRYACRAGTPSLELSHVQTLVAAGQQLQELDLSLHGQLDDDCMRLLARCQKLRKLTLSRSHKVSASGVEALLLAEGFEELTLVRCKGISKPRLKQMTSHFPLVAIHLDRQQI